MPMNAQSFLFEEEHFVKRMRAEEEACKIRMQEFEEGSRKRVREEEDAMRKRGEQLTIAQIETVDLLNKRLHGL